MYDTFISYRRDGGKEIAPRIYDYLKTCGFEAFLDTAEMAYGRFDEQLRAKVEESENFILVLSRGALDRCVEEGDWVREEIKLAINLNKNIVVFQAENFEYPLTLPEDIERIKLYQCILYHDTTVHLQIKHLVGALKSKHQPESVVIDSGKDIGRRVKFSGKYITEYEDIESNHIVMRKAPAQLYQFGTKIWGTTEFSSEKQWRIQARVYNHKQIAGIYYARGYLDDGFGTFFLEAKSTDVLEGFWSGYDSVAKKVTSGRYVFHRKYNDHKIAVAKEEDYSSIVKIAASRLGKNYVTHKELAAMTARGARCLVAKDKHTKKVLGFCIVDVIGYEKVLEMTKGRQIVELREDSKIGYVKTIAIGRKYAGKGIGTDLLSAAVQTLKASGVESYVSTAWKHAGIINVASLLSGAGFVKKMELENYWLQSSIDENFDCPHCGHPCYCSCVIYIKNEA